MDSARSQGCVKPLPRPQPTSSSVQRKALWHWKVTLHCKPPLLPWHQSALCLCVLCLRTTFSLYEFVLNISYKQNHTTWHFQFLSLGVVLSEFISVRTCRIIFVLILRFYLFFVCMSVDLNGCLCIMVHAAPKDAQRGQWMPWDWSYRHLGVSIEC